MLRATALVIVGLVALLATPYFRSASDTDAPEAASRASAGSQSPESQSADGVAAQAALSREQYASELSSAEATLNQSIGRFDGSAADVRAKVVNAQAVLRRTADELAAVQPPREVADAHTLLVDSLRTLANDLDGALRELDSTGDLDAMRNRIASFASLAKLDQALRGFEAASYDIR